jgi:hypothetical protein
MMTTQCFNLASVNRNIENKVKRIFFHSNIFKSVKTVETFPAEKNIVSDKKIH